MHVEEIMGIKGVGEDDSSNFFIRHFMGHTNCEMMKMKYLPRKPNLGEHLLTFGTFKGYTLEQVNEFDHLYIVFLSTFDIKKLKKLKWQDIYLTSLRARELVTKEEREEKLRKIEYINSRIDRMAWLLRFIRNYEDKGIWERDKYFLRSIRFQLLRQMRIDLLTKKQLTVIANIWARYYSGKDEGIKWRNERERFKEKMRPYWKRKYDRIEDI